MSLSRFDLAAATWDEQPARLVLTRAIAEAVRTQVPLHPSMTALDFGCGTGLLSLALQPVLHRVIGIDSSSGMLEKMQEKSQAMHLDNVETRLLDLTSEAPPADLHAELIFSAMALHHIADLPRLLQVFCQLLSPGGWLALADLDSEDGSFHPDLTGVYHSGIDRAWLQAQLETLGFHHLRATTAHVIERPNEQGALRQYPVFLVSGQRGS